MKNVTYVPNESKNARRILFSSLSLLHKTYRFRFCESLRETGYNLSTFVCMLLYDVQYNTVYFHAHRR